MLHVLVILPARGCRRWQIEAAKRLTAAGYAVSIGHARQAPPAAAALDAVLAMEGRLRGPSLASPCEPLPATDPAGAAALVVDLAGSGAQKRNAPVLTIDFSGHDSFPAGLTEFVAGGRLPELAVFLKGAVVARGRPMIRDRLWLARASDDLLAGAVSLLVQAVNRVAARKADTFADASPAPGRKGFAAHYPAFAAKGLFERVARKLRRGRRPFYWQVGYRLIDGPGVAETGRLDGAPFAVLPDDGRRFYADPFVFEHGGTFLFVEEFPYATGRGVIAVAELRGDGTFGTPRVVLEEPHHLSYPQVFALDGEVFMLPESAAARELVLYRAARFPDLWVRDTVLIADRDINDATLLEHGGRFWLVGTERFGCGSASDTMVVFSAADLRGPWSAHPLNPVAVDHSAARPGGAFIRGRENILLPVQNGSRSYGGGLGLMRLERLDGDDVRFGAPSPILPGPAWARGGIHTLNRAGRVETVDSAG